jgi:hypothetical protein
MARVRGSLRNAPPSRSAARDSRLAFVPSPPVEPAESSNIALNVGPHLHLPRHEAPYADTQAVEDNLPARNEANERRRMRKYEPDVQEEWASKRRLLSTVIRNNKKPASWKDLWVFKASNRKKGVVAVKPHIDEANTPDQQDQELPSPILPVSFDANPESVPTLQLDDELDFDSDSITPSHPPGRSLLPVSRMCQYANPSRPIQSCPIDPRSRTGRQEPHARPFSSRSSFCS